VTENEEEKQVKLKVEELLAKYPTVARKDGSFGRTNVIQHKIEITTNKPIRTRAARYGPTYANEIRRQVNEMLERKLIREVKTSEYSANVVLSPKPNGKLRMNISYKKFIMHTKDNVIDMHKGDYILKRLPQGGYLTKIDLQSGFWKVGMEPESVKYTTFQFEGKLYEFLVMPFGMKNSSATFVALMNQVLGDFIGKFCFVYIDDIIIFSNTLEEHFQHIEQIFKKFQETNLSISTEKSEFCKREVEFLGHIITKDGMQKASREGTSNSRISNTKRQGLSTKISGNLRLVPIIHSKLLCQSSTTIL